MLSALVALGAFGGCATLPDSPLERGLYVDVRKTVEFEQQVDWVSDRLEVDNLVSHVMGSVCQTSPETRRRLIDWLDLRIVARGGPSQELYEREGRERTAAVRRVQSLERTRALLMRAHELAETDCPYWLEEDPDFRGIQRDEGRLVILAESMGGAAVSVAQW